MWEQIPDLPAFKVIGAAFTGSVISRRFRPEMSRIAFLSSILSSVAMAYFIATPLAKAFGNEEYAPIIGSLIGIFGLTICITIEKTIKETDWSGILKSRLGGGE